MKKLAGSYTVEATLVMSIVLFTMAAFIRFGYQQCRQATGTMRLHEMVEIMRHQEKGEEQRSINASAYQIYAEKKGSQVKGTIQGDGWKLTIENRVFEPEEFIRKLTLLPEEKQGEIEVK